MKANPEKLKAWKARSKGLKSKSGFKRPATGHRKPKVKRKVTKASKLRRKRGEWSTDTADARFSTFIRQRDGKCLRCGTLEGLTCSHYHGRGKSATRFDPINCIALCWTCHQEWEGPKSDYTTFMIDRIGVDAFLALTLRAGEYKERKEAVADCKRFLASL